MNKAYLLTGGNIGDRAGILETARNQIGQRCGLITKQSSLYQTAAWGLEAQADFLNQVLEIETTLDATQLLTTLLQIEKQLGRERHTRYGPRLIDLDILFFNNDIIEEETLTIPHPQLQNRRFVLVPLVEIAPTLLHPVFHKTVLQLLQESPDSLPVQKFR